MLRGCCAFSGSQRRGQSGFSHWPQFVATVPSSRWERHASEHIFPDIFIVAEGTHAQCIPWLDSPATKNWAQAILAPNGLIGRLGTAPQPRGNNNDGFNGPHSFDRPSMGIVIASGVQLKPSPLQLRE